MGRGPWLGCFSAQLGGWQTATHDEAPMDSDFDLFGCLACFASVSRHFASLDGPHTKTEFVLILRFRMPRRCPQTWQPLELAVGAVHVRRLYIST
jgi:hypothetical protein